MSASIATRGQAPDEQRPRNQKGKFPSPEDYMRPDGECVTSDVFDPRRGSHIKPNPLRGVSIGTYARHVAKVMRDFLKAPQATIDELNAGDKYSLNPQRRNQTLFKDLDHSNPDVRMHALEELLRRCNEAPQEIATLACARLEAKPLYEERQELLALFGYVMEESVPKLALMIKAHNDGTKKDSELLKTIAGILEFEIGAEVVCRHALLLFPELVRLADTHKNIAIPLIFNFFKWRKVKDNIPPDDLSNYLVLAKGFAEKIRGEYGYLASLTLPPEG